MDSLVNVTHMHRQTGKVPAVQLWVGVETPMIIVIAQNATIMQMSAKQPVVKRVNFPLFTKGKHTGDALMLIQSSLGAP
jgi:hypothetical protein